MAEDSRQRRLWFVWSTTAKGQTPRGSLRVPIQNRTPVGCDEDCNLRNSGFSPRFWHSVVCCSIPPVGICKRRAVSRAQVRPGVYRYNRASPTIRNGLLDDLSIDRQVNIIYHYGSELEKNGWAQASFGHPDRRSACCVWQF